MTDKINKLKKYLVLAASSQKEPSRLGSSEIPPELMEGTAEIRIAVPEEDFAVVCRLGDGIIWSLNAYAEILGTAVIAVVRGDRLYYSTEVQVDIPRVLNFSGFATTEWFTNARDQILVAFYPA